MGVGYNPKIVIDGLVLALDAGNIKSYPGSGTTWTDLSGNNNNGTLINGVGYSGDNLGSLVFDGTNDYVTNGNTNFSIANNLFADANGSWTVSAWFKFPISPSGTRTGNQSWSIVGRSGGIATGGTFDIFVGSATDTTYGAYAPYKCACLVRGSVTVISTNSVNDDVWHNVSIVWNALTETGEVFFDGVKTADLNNTILAALQTYNLTIGTTSNSSASHMYEGSISNAIIHNRALTAAEIQQNFNALRGRFGV